MMLKLDHYSQRTPGNSNKLGRRSCFPIWPSNNNNNNIYKYISYFWIITSGFKEHMARVFVECFLQFYFSLNCLGLTFFDKNVTKQNKMTRWYKHRYLQHILFLLEPKTTKLLFVINMFSEFYLSRDSQQKLCLIMIMKTYVIQRIW